jgi:hypothetical protein
LGELQAASFKRQENSKAVVAMMRWGDKAAADLS